MKKIVLILGVLVSLSAVIYLALTLLKIDNPKAEMCDIQTKTIISISKSTANDIVFSDYQGDHYYINRGLERGLNLDTLHVKVLNKTVTLHLPKILGGIATSEYIAQIAVGDDIIFSELK